MMLRADKVIPAGHWSGAPADTVVLDFDERYRRRVAMTGVGGLEFLLDLPEATMLRGGDGLRLEDGRVVEVVAEPEPLAEIRAADPLALTRVAWHLGNRHLPTEMTAKGAAHPPRSRHRGDGRGSRRPGDRARSAVQSRRRRLCEGRGRRRSPTMATITATITTTITTTSREHDHATTIHDHHGDHGIMTTITAPAIIQITSTSMGIGNDLEAGRLALPETACVGDDLALSDV